MSTYTIKNLKEVEDMAAGQGLGPDLEARFARQQLGAERVGLSYQRLAPMARMPFAHAHHEDEEIYVVVGGGGHALLDTDSIEIRQWDAIRVPPGTVRSFSGGPDGLELLAFGTHTEDDAAMKDADWPT